MAIGICVRHVIQGRFSEFRLPNSRSAVVLRIGREKSQIRIYGTIIGSEMDVDSLDFLQLTFYRKPKDGENYETGPR